MVVEVPQVALRVGVQPLLQKLGDDPPLRVQAPRRDVHQRVKPPVEVRLVLRQVRDSGHVDRHHADGPRALAAAEEPARLLAQLPQVQPQPAAHAAHVAGLHVGVDVVGEVGRAVLRRHLEQQLVVLRLRPVEVPGDGIGGDRVLEAPAVGVALDHDLDERLVHHVHFPLAIAVGEVHLPAAHDGGQVLQVVRHGPVQRDVAERRLRAPAARRVHAVDEALHALLDFLLRQVVHPHEGRQVGVEAGKRLGPRPLVLHDAQEVHHLVA